MYDAHTAGFTTCTLTTVDIFAFGLYYTHQSKDTNPKDTKYSVFFLQPKIILSPDF